MKVDLGDLNHISAKELTRSRYWE